MPPPGFPRIAELAGVYCHGITNQRDPISPTGYWRGMLAEDNDHETFAGFCSGVMADVSLLPPALQALLPRLPGPSPATRPRPISDRLAEKRARGGGRVAARAVSPSRRRGRPRPPRTGGPRAAAVIPPITTSGSASRPAPAQQRLPGAGPALALVVVANIGPAET